MELVVENPVGRGAGVLNRVSESHGHQMARSRHLLSTYAKSDRTGCDHTVVKSWGLWQHLTLLRKLGLGGRSIGGPEGAAACLQSFLIDKDGSGDVGVDEVEQTAGEMSESANGLIINMGVVGALLLSFTFPMVVTPVEVSQSSVDFFGENGVRVLQDIYYGALILMVALAISLIAVTVMSYKHLNFWMTSPAMKIWWCQEVSAKPIVHLAQAQFIILGFIPGFGCAAHISPKVALMASCGSLFTLFFIMKSFIVESRCWSYQHWMIGKYVEQRKPAISRVDDPFTIFLESNVVVAQAIEVAGLTIKAMTAARSDLLLDSMLREVGVVSPGLRLETINAIHESAQHL